MNKTEKQLLAIIQKEFPTAFITDSFSDLINIDDHIGFIVPAEKKPKKKKKNSWESDDEDDNYLEFMFAHGAEQLHFCCGVEEIGDFKEVTSGNDENISDATKIAAAAITLLELTETYKKSRAKIKTFKPLVFTATETGASAYFAKAAELHLPDTFKLVATSRNPGSGNVIKTFISVK